MDDTIAIEDKPMHSNNGKQEMKGEERQKVKTLHSSISSVGARL